MHNIINSQTYGTSYIEFKNQYGEVSLHPIAHITQGGFVRPQERANRVNNFSVQPIKVDPIQGPKQLLFTSPVA
ncbi:MAG: hypothetical protein EXR35_00820 [Limnohabitans sp.]|nr:hypothetical protein [Limnohabitans sp.]